MRFFRLQESKETWKSNAIHIPGDYLGPERKKGPLLSLWCWHCKLNSSGGPKLASPFGVLFTGYGEEHPSLEEIQTEVFKGAGTSCQQPILIRLKKKKTNDHTDIHTHAHTQNTHTWRQYSKILTIIGSESKGVLCPFGTSVSLKSFQN